MRESKNFFSESWFQLQNAIEYLVFFDGQSKTLRLSRKDL